jgi:hypothetical protein
VLSVYCLSANPLHRNRSCLNPCATHTHSLPAGSFRVARSREANSDRGLRRPRPAPIPVGYGRHQGIMLRIARARRMSWLLPLSNQQPASDCESERRLPTFLNTLGTLLWHSLALRSKETVWSSRPPPGHCGPNSVDQNSGPRCPSPVADSELEGTEVPPSTGSRPGRGIRRDIRWDMR